MDEELEPAQAKTMIKGESDALNSSFHLGYNMLLNLLRVEEAGECRGCVTDAGCGTCHMGME